MSMQDTACRCNCGSSTDAVEVTTCEEPPLSRQGRISARPETDPSDSSDSSDLESHDSVWPACSTSDDIADDVFQAEMRSLRKALAELAASTSHGICVPVVELTAPSAFNGIDAFPSRQITELEVQVDRLTLENEQLDAANRSLRSEVSRLNELLRQQDEGDVAEAEILRRRLDSAETRHERLQAELADALLQHEGKTRGLDDQEVS